MVVSPEPASRVRFSGHDATGGCYCLGLHESWDTGSPLRNALLKLCISCAVGSADFLTGGTFLRTARGNPWGLVSDTHHLWKSRHANRGWFGRRILHVRRSTAGAY